MGIIRVFESNRSSVNNSNIQIFEYPNIRILVFDATILYGLWCIKAYEKWIRSQRYLLFDMAIKIQK
jgi:hypothetical protein